MRGLRGRHIFGASSKLSGRCFQWSVHPNKAQCNQLEFRTSEFVLSGDTGLRKPHTTIRADSLNALWNAVFTSIYELEDISLSPPKRGAMLCGFTNPSLAVLMGAYSLKGGPSFAKDLEAMSDQYVRYLASSANRAFEHAMHSVCPSNPKKAFEALRRSVSFAAE